MRMQRLFVRFGQQGITGDVGDFVALYSSAVAKRRWAGNGHLLRGRQVQIQDQVESAKRYFRTVILFSFVRH